MTTYLTADLPIEGLLWTLLGCDIVAIGIATVLAIVVMRQHRTLDNQAGSLDDQAADAVELNRRNEWQAGEILRLRSSQPTQVMQVRQPSAPSHRYDGSNAT